MGLFNSPGLLEWFSREGVEYPWGRDPSPYRVWISEVMLQQTVVTAVIPFFNRWMETFPTLDALASAGEGEVLRLWEGLGYYSRARNIHKASRLIKERGRFPDTYKDLTDLPGIGDYTACAILSMAYGIPRPVLDANVKRIFQRLELRTSWSRREEGECRRRLDAEIDRDRPGEFNGALMQLGQLVCKRKRPLCGDCPLAEGCGAFREKRTDEIPAVRKKRIIEKESRLLIFKHLHGNRRLYWIIRRREGIGRGLWAFPRILSGISMPKGWGTVHSLSTRVHLYTRYREFLMPVILEYRGNHSDLPPLPGSAREEGDGFWATAGELCALAVPAVYRKIIDELITWPGSE